MPDDVLPAQSMVEAYLYLLVTPCAVCRHGATDASLPTAGPEGTVRVVVTCRNCGGAEEYRVPYSGVLPTFDVLSGAEPISRSPAPSRLIDLHQWLTLYHVMAASAAETPDRQEARWRCVRARQCLDEALKFYAADTDLPPDSALFTEETRRLLHEHPERFLRSRVIELRHSLPTESATMGEIGRPEVRRRSWWRFWEPHH